MAKEIDELLIEYMKGEFNSIEGALEWYQKWLNEWYRGIPGYIQWSREEGLSNSDVINHIRLVFKDREIQRKEKTPLGIWIEHDNRIKELERNQFNKSTLESCDCTSVNVGDEYQATLEGYKEAIKAKDELISVLKENIAIMGAQLSIKWNQDATSKTMNEHG